MHARVMMVGVAVLHLATVGVGAAGKPKVRHQEPVEHFGMCDASAGASLGEDLFVVANDEDCILRVYAAEVAGGPVASYDLGSFLGLGHGKSESDVEGCARVGERLYWITSHSSNPAGRHRAQREAFFATRVTRGPTGPGLEPEGRPYRSLLKDMLEAPELSRLGLRRAAELPPKERGGLDIEGLCDRPDGSLWIGFRGPLPEGRAPLVPLLNPAEVVTGHAARLGEPRLLDLRGMGVRDLARVGAVYYIVAGAEGSGGKSVLYRWSGGADAPVPEGRISFEAFNPEALIWGPEFGPRDMLLLSDDGRKDVGGVPCKDVKDPMQRAFRGAWIRVPR
jgi:hypothetical protein